MNVQTAEKENRSVQYYNIIIRYLAVLLVCCVISLFLEYSQLWKNNLSLLHTFLELTCVFIAISSFSIVFLTYKSNNQSTRIVGFGFLAVAIYDMLHIYYFPSLSLYPAGYYDLAARYWVIARFTEAFVLFLSMSMFLRKHINKWVLFSVTIAIAFGTSLIILSFPNIMPLLYSPSGVTSAKIVMEYIVIALFIIDLFFMHRRIGRKGIFAYSYIYTAILLVVASELCFTFLNSLDSFYSILGHILKISFYFNLFIGIFVSAVIYPYEKIKKAMDALKTSRKELREILNGLPLGIITYDNSLKVNFTNRKALELFGCKYEDILGLTERQLTEKLLHHPDSDQENLVLSVNKHPDTIYNKVKKYKTLNGKEISLNVNAFKYINGVLTSFTDTKKEQELANLQIQTRTVIESINNSIVITDSSFKIILFNKTFLKDIEMEQENIIGMHIGQLKQKLEYSIKNTIYNAENENAPYAKTQEITLITPKGTKKELLLHSSPITNVADEIIGHIIVSSDITALKEQQRKLHQQDKLALVGQMGSGIVHETKNYLASIRGYCQLLSWKVSDVSLKKYIDKIQSITDEVNRVIVDFLSLAKPSDTVMDIISLNELIESISFMLESPSFMKNVQIDISLTDVENDIKADESQIKQVVLNIAKNAIEAMEDTANAKLSICTQLNSNHNEMCLIISDNGKGISKENLKKLGTPFFTTKETGTGLGISVCYRVIKEHGGHIEVLSEEGTGTTFTISLPCYNYNEEYPEHI